jgi:hypothetical protein
MEKINLNKVVYPKNQYERVIDTKFSQLATSPSSQEIANTLADSAITPSISINQFFEYYNELFFQIPKKGALFSHEYLVKTSGEYIGSTFLNDELQALIDEINILQQNNLELNQQIIELQSTSSNSSITTF